VGGALSACAVNNLIGSQAAVGNVELRWPLWNSVLAGLPLPFAGLETALFFDAGLVWDNDSNIKWNRDEGDPYVDLSPIGGPSQEVRNVVRSWGASLRGNLLGFLPLRLDYARPLGRPMVKHYWTLSLGPTF
jgi:outer membrane protein assembly factor BamA